jgi:hypothetical protein
MKYAQCNNNFQKLSFVPFYSTFLLRGFVQYWIFYEDIKQRMDHEYPTLSAQRIVFVYASVNIVEFLFWEAVQLSWLLFSIFIFIRWQVRTNGTIPETFKPVQWWLESSFNHNHCTLVFTVMLCMSALVVCISLVFVTNTSVFLSWALMSHFMCTVQYLILHIPPIHVIVIDIIERWLCGVAVTCESWLIIVVDTAVGHEVELKLKVSWYCPFTV